MLNAPAQVPCPFLEVQTFPVYTCSFTVTAMGGTVSYTISEPAGETSEYTINILQNASGTLSAGQQQTVKVSVIGPLAPPTSEVPSLTVSPGGASIQFSLLQPGG